ncbi:U3 small nucleolar RNA-associated protein 18 homolog isoform X2 [Oscarella lobularis]|uniref:U3 small nucleolar RNA-associated protein 18 homolog isoform X2 n=1 Tax=Oscarella lobularis TaxID=121494 RepID=UPI00331425DA
MLRKRLRQDPSPSEPKRLSKSAAKADERRLEALVFGNEEELLEKFAAKGEIVKTAPTIDRKPAWIDEDDEREKVEIATKKRLKKLRSTAEEKELDGTTYTSRLRKQFERVTGTPSWADLSTKKSISDEDEDEDEDQLLRRSGKLLAAHSDCLPRGILDIRQLKHGNQARPAKAVVQALEFHPTNRVLLVSGFHKTIDLFQIDGRENPHVQGIHFDRFPVHAAHFTPDGRQIVATSRRREFYAYDLLAGKATRIPGIRGRNEKSFEKFTVSPDNKYLAFLGDDGYIILLSNKTKQWVANLKMNGTVTAIAFSPDGSLLLSHGSDGVVYVWDMKTRDCVNTFTDDGCVYGKSVAVSSGNQFVACGSDSGVVNIYDSACFRENRPKPVKSVMNLTTSIKETKFNHTSEILGMSSRTVEGAFRLLHVPSMTVFSNWPHSTSLNFVNAFDFSKHSGYLTIGNDKGKALLYRLNHYKDW